MEEKTTRTALSPAEYWEWRTTIAEMECAKQKLKNEELNYKLLTKDTEIHAVRQQLFLRTRMEAARDALKSAHSEYERYKEVLEKSLGQSLNNKIIDDITFEIRELPDETQQTSGEPTQKKE